MPAETVPDDPIVELPMKVLCSVCGVMIKETVAEWPQSDIDRMKKMSGWTGVIISHGYCPKHNPLESESV